MQTRGVVALNIRLSSKYNEGNLLTEKLEPIRYFLIIAVPRYCRLKGRVKGYEYFPINCSRLAPP